MAIVSLDDAKIHIRRYDEDDDARLSQKLEHASAIITDYLKVAPGTWDIDGEDPREAPYQVKAACLIVFGNLAADESADPITTAVVNLLNRSRDPALA